MGKASKKKSRRDHRGSRRNNDDLEHANKKQTGESSSAILTDLNSLDSAKRNSAIVMFKDLLMQNINNVTVIGKLATNETLSSLSLRLIDSNTGIRMQAVKCFLAIVRSGVKFAEKIVNLGIHETIRNMLIEVTSQPSSDSDEAIDDLLCIIYLLCLHYPSTYSNNSDALLSLALSNMSPGVPYSRRVSFSEYLSSCSSSTATVTAQQSAWGALYRELSAVISTQRLCLTSESPSDYLLVLQCAVVTNLLTAIPAIPHDEALIRHVLAILTDSLYLSHASFSPPPTTDSMVVDAGDTAAHVIDSSIGKYKSLSLKVNYAMASLLCPVDYQCCIHHHCGLSAATTPSVPPMRYPSYSLTFGARPLLRLNQSFLHAPHMPLTVPYRYQVAAEALSKFFTDQEKVDDSTSSKKSATSSADFKGRFREGFNAYFSVCLQSAVRLAVLSTSKAADSVPIAESLTAGAGAGLVSEVDSSKIVAEGTGSEDVISGMAGGGGEIFSGEAPGSDSNIDDVLEVFLSSLCAATDYAALSLNGESQHIMPRLCLRR